MHSKYKKRILRHQVRQTQNGLHYGPTDGDCESHADRLTCK